MTFRVETNGASSPASDPAPAAAAFPVQPFVHLDALWLQVAGTLCNLACTHCFVPSGPGITRHALMARDEVRSHVRDALRLGVREFYFTGGEPFLHPDLLPMLEETLADGPATVLTNGTLFTRRRVGELRRMSDASRHSLEIRVSLDGTDAASHDLLRGPGAFVRTMEGLRSLDAAGLMPIVTVTRHRDEPPLAFRERIAALLRGEGVARPRIKVLPLFRLGRELDRRGPGAADDTLAGVPQEMVEAAGLQCSSCRAVTSRGVFVCPLLVDEPHARLGGRLEGALGAFELRHGACHTCWVSGMTCANA